MPPSQLKSLKSSLREQGITGPQKSKKQKKQASKNGGFRDARIQRIAALEGIREQFNPFEIRAPARPSKHDIASHKTLAGKGAKGAVARLGTTKSLGEEQRRQTLLKEIHRRKKVGGILDRRFGENDPTMTPEEKALQRFVKEKQRGSRKDNLFDLEDENEDDQLTHFGQSLSFDKPTKIDDSQQVHLTSEEESDGTEGLERPSKRRKLSPEAESDKERLVGRGADQSERPKSKREVMSEVIAKSKLHKYERQRAKEDDDDLRAELDKGLPDLLAFMRGTQQPPLLPQPPEVNPNGIMNPDRAAMLNGKDRAEAEKEYDQRLNQMLFDKRSRPSERTLTEDEKLEKEAQRLKGLEEERLRRMKGGPDTDEEENDLDEAALEGDGDYAQKNPNTFGLGSGLDGRTDRQQLEVEDEDEFIIEDDLVASDSALEASNESSEDGSTGESSDEEDEEFVRGLVTEHDAGRRELDAGGERGLNGNTIPKALPYTYNCPQSHEEFIQITRDVPIGDQPTVVQRIRALHHPKLQAGNKAKLQVFSTILVDHVFYLATNSEEPSFAALEALVRHIHSLAKMFPEAVGRAFRKYISSLAENRPLDPNAGDLVVLAAIGSIFPTSDHFHQVVTPAVLCMGLYLGQKIPRSLSDLATGVYLSTLCLQFQRLSARYIPELVNYVLNALLALAPVHPSAILGWYPQYSLPPSLRVKEKPVDSPRRLKFWDTIVSHNTTEEACEELKLALLNTTIAMCGEMAFLWIGKPAFFEILEPVAACLKHLTSKACVTKIGERIGTKAQGTLQKIKELLQQARKARRPLLLHNHRPLPIKTSIPKFEESFNPDKHYDPDRDRAQMNRLKAEHEKERKGALRELRKDANFIARESLREKKERDTQYDKKFKRLVAEIQGEEGREAKDYEREKRIRKGKR
ncbi:MAG: hypothetical protein Q9216_000592 [Gyalolechia sp. 2 TL-2023]